MQKKSLIIYIGLLLAISGLMFTNGVLLPHQNNTQAYGVNNGGNVATIGTRLVGTTSDSVETASAPIEMTGELTSAASGTAGALNFTSPPQTFEEWRSFLLAWNNMTLDDLENADPITVQTLDQEAHIYEGCTNGTYTEQQKSQLLAELHHTPSIGAPTYYSTTDHYFSYSFPVYITTFGEHSFRVYWYMDYDKSDTLTAGGNRFKDGMSEKIYGPYIYFPVNDPYPYDTLPYLPETDPATAFMGSSYNLIGWYHGKVELTATYSGYNGGIVPGDHYFVTQVLYKWDEFIAFQFRYWAHFLWITRIDAVTIQDNDITPPTIQEIKVDSVSDSQANFPIGVKAADGSGIDGIYFNGVLYYSQYANGYYWISVPSPRTPGTYTGTITVWDADNDFSGDELSTTQTFTYTITDDDVTPPTVTWSTTDIRWSGNMIQLTFTVDATDARGIGSVYIWIGGYRFDSLGSHSVILPPGQYTAYISVTDGDNDWSGDSMTTSIQQAIVLDLSPPTTGLIFGPYFSDGTRCYVTSGTVFTLSPTDDVTGVAHTYHQINGGPLSTYTIFSLSGPDGVYTVSYWSIDYAGNVESVKTKTVVLDNAAPVTSLTPSGVHGLGDWYKSDVLVTLSPTDGSSGVARTLYYDGSNWVTYEGPFAVGREGSTTIYYYSIDNIGNVEAMKTEVVNIDWAAPETTKSLSGTVGLGDWYLSPVTVTLTATDDYSGVSTTQYSFNGIDWDTYTGSFTVSADGLTSVYYRSIDNAGNVECTKITQIMIDRTPPATTISVSGTLGLGGWYKSDVTVTLEAADPDPSSGIARTEYSFDGTNWINYTSPFTIMTEGQTTIYYRSVDVAGNTETLQSLEIWIDKTPPTTTASLYGTLDLNDWFVSQVSVTLSATDSFSGVDRTEYKIDDGPWTFYAEPFTIEKEGSTTVCYRSVDKATNTEGIETLSFKIDRTPPATTSTLQGEPGLRDWFITDVTVTLSAADPTPGSGVAFTEYSLDNITWTRYEASFIIPYRDITTIYYRSTDNAGNIEQTESVQVKIYIPAETTIGPRTLNLKSNGQWVTVCIELPQGYNANEINISSLELRYGDNSIHASWGQVEDGVLMVKFDRAALINMLTGTPRDTEVQLEIWGEVAGCIFAGTVTIKVI